MFKKEFQFVLIEKKLIWSLILLNIILSILNQNSQMMGGLMDYYFDFKNIILHNFDIKYSKMNCPTFPMWGYGWVLIFISSKFWIFFFQGGLSIFSVLYIYFILRSLKYLNLVQLKFLRVAICLSLSFFSLNFTLSPYSLAISLQVLSIAFLIKGYFEEVRIYKFLFTFFSGICFGILLNFRSDYIYAALILPLIVFLFQISRLNFVIMLFWAFSTFCCLIPWLIYTNKVIGEPIFTSTNSGHVFYIGLGNLPNNVWGISTSDQDRRMYDELRGKFGARANSLRFREDIYLKKRFVELVKNNPVEYLKKVFISGLKTTVSGIYVPEFFNILNNCKSGDCKSEFIFDLSNRPFRALNDGFIKSIVYLITYLSVFGGIMVIFIGYILLPVVILKLISQKNLLIIICVFFMIYQLLINSFAYQMKLYSSYSYFWSLLVIAFYIKDFNFKKINK
jgi:hypothetical protein